MTVIYIDDPEGVMATVVCIDCIIACFIMPFLLPRVPELQPTIYIYDMIHRYFCKPWIRTY